MKRYGQLIILPIVLSLLSVSSISQPTSGLSSQGHEVIQSIGLLLSESASERRAGKQKILREGAKAIPSLLVLLDATISQTVFVQVNPPGYKPPLAGDAVTWIVNGEPLPEEQALVETARRSLEVKARIRNDVMEVLRRLGAEEKATSVVVQCLYKPEFLDGSIDASISRVPGMETLESLGAKAIPSVLEVFEHADEFAKSAPFRGLKVRARAAMVLGEIGNKNVLPSLENVMKTLAEQKRLELRTAHYIEEAIGKIRRRGR